MMDWTVICATNDDKVLESCLLKSPDIRHASDVILERGYSSAAVALNSGLQKCKTDLVVCAHQDVYFPAGWTDALRRSLSLILVSDPNWGVLGVWGVKRSAVCIGHVYSSGLSKILGQSFEEPVEVESLDEVVLILRRSSGLRFDDGLPGFHMYGTDICLEARRQSMRCYAISAFCIHNSNGYSILPVEYWESYWLMREKWKSRLPVVTTCKEINFWCWPLIQSKFARAASLVRRQQTPGRRVADPARLYDHLVREGSC